MENSLKSPRHVFNLLKTKGIRRVGMRKKFDRTALRKTNKIFDKRPKALSLLDWKKYYHCHWELEVSVKTQFMKILWPTFFLLGSDFG